MKREGAPCAGEERVGMGMSRRIELVDGLWVDRRRQ